MVKEIITTTLKEHKVVVFSKSYCPFCTKAKKALAQLLKPEQFFVLEIENRSDMDELQDELLSMTGGRSVPRVFVDGQFIGGGDETAALVRNGQLAEMLQQKGIVTS